MEISLSNGLKCAIINILHNSNDKLANLHLRMHCKPSVYKTEDTRWEWRVGDRRPIFEKPSNTVEEEG